jgi:hypothetical protein
MSPLHDAQPLSEAPAPAAATPESSPRASDVAADPQAFNLGTRAGGYMVCKCCLLHLMVDRKACNGSCVLGMRSICACTICTPSTYFVQVCITCALLAVCYFRPPCRALQYHHSPPASGRRQGITASCGAAHCHKGGLEGYLGLAGLWGPECWHWLAG